MLYQKAIALSALTLISFNTWAADLFVSQTGSDNNPGTQAAPLKSIVKAAQIATEGTVVRVLPGTYSGGIRSIKSGKENARIVFKSETRGKAKIVPSTSKVIWDVRGNYVDIIGFEIDGIGNSTVTNGIYLGGSYGSAQYNHVHHLATALACTSGGGSAIGTDHYYKGINNDVIGNEVHHIGSAKCDYIQGIYISTSGNVKNNLAYNVGAAAIHLWHDATDVNIVNNTVAASGYGIIVGGGDFYYSENRKADDVKVLNNIVVGNKYGISEQGTTGLDNEYINNLVYNNTLNWDLDKGKKDVGTITKDPQFVKVDVNGINVDFRLRAASPALNAGVSSSLNPLKDIAEVLRSSGGVIDLGAYEQAITVTPPRDPAQEKAPVLSLSVTSLTLANTVVGRQSAIRIVTLKNVGTANLLFPAGFVLDGPFAFGGTGTCKVNVAVVPGGSCTASVVFKPTKRGLATGSLSIKSNASSVVQKVVLRGTGL